MCYDDEVFSMMRDIFKTQNKKRQNPCSEKIISEYCVEITYCIFVNDSAKEVVTKIENSCTRSQQFLTRVACQHVDYIETFHIHVIGYI